MIHFISDAHLGKNLREADAEFQQDSFKAFERAIDKAVERQVTAVIFAGDTTDKAHTTGAVIEVLRQGIDKLTDAGIDAYFIQGNHDRQVKWHKRRVPILQALGCIHIDGKTVEVDGLKIHGMDYVAGRAVRKALESVPECDILVMHQAFHHLLRFKDDVRIEDIPKHVGNVVVGDIHIHDIRQGLPSGGFICSPGPLHPCDQGQAPHAGKLLIGVPMEGSVIFREDPIGTRLIHRVSITPDMGPDTELFRKVAMETAQMYTVYRSVEKANGWKLPKPVLSLRVSQGMDEAAASFVKNFADMFIIWTEPAPSKNMDMFDDEGAEIASVEVMSMQEAVPHVADPEAEDEIELTLALLDTDNITQTIAGWVDSRMNGDD